MFTSQSYSVYALTCPRFDQASGGLQTLFVKKLDSQKSLIYGCYLLRDLPDWMLGWWAGQRANGVRPSVGRIRLLPRHMPAGWPRPPGPIPREAPQSSLCHWVCSLQKEKEIKSICPWEKWLCMFLRLCLDSHPLFRTAFSRSFTGSLSSLARAAMSVVFTVTVDFISLCASLTLSWNTLKKGIDLKEYQKVLGHFLIYI